MAGVDIWMWGSALTAKNAKGRDSVTPHLPPDILALRTPNAETPPLTRRKPSEDASQDKGKDEQGQDSPEAGRAYYGRQGTGLPNQNSATFRSPAAQQPAPVTFIENLPSTEGMFNWPALGGSRGGSRAGSRPVSSRLLPHSLSSGGLSRKESGRRTDSGDQESGRSRQYEAREESNSQAGPSGRPPSSRLTPMSPLESMRQSSQSRLAGSPAKSPSSILWGDWPHRQPLQYPPEESKPSKRSGGPRFVFPRELEWSSKQNSPEKGEGEGSGSEAASDAEEAELLTPLPSPLKKEGSSGSAGVPALARLLSLNKQRAEIDWMHADPDADPAEDDLPDITSRKWEDSVENQKSFRGPLAPAGTPLYTASAPASPMKGPRGSFSHQGSGAGEHGVPSDRTEDCFNDEPYTPTAAVYTPGYPCVDEPLYMHKTDLEAGAANIEAQRAIYVAALRQRRPSTTNGITPRSAGATPGASASARASTVGGSTLPSPALSASASARPEGLSPRSTTRQHRTLKKGLKALVPSEPLMGCTNSEGGTTNDWRQFGSKIKDATPAYMRTSGGWIPRKGYAREGVLAPGKRTRAVAKARELEPCQRLRDDLRFDTEQLSRHMSPGGSSLDLSHSLCGPRLLAALQESLDRSGGVDRLVMRQCQVKDDAVILLAKSWDGTMLQRLRIVDLSANDISWRGVAPLLGMLGRMNVLTTLVLCGNKVSNRGAEKIATRLSVSNRVTALDLSHNEIGVPGAIALRDMISENTVLQKLELGWNTMCPRGAEALSEGLRYSASLVHLDLSWNGIQDSGAMHIAQAILNNETLTSLNLAGNNVGTPTSHVLSEACLRRTQLSSLVLSDNPLGREGASALLRSMSQAQHITHMSLMRCSLVWMRNTTTVFYDPKHPNNTYCLDLGNPSQQMIAVKLCELASTQGMETWKSPLFRGEPLLPAVLQQWVSNPDRIPEKGILEFEFLSNQRPGKNVEAISARDLNRIVTGLMLDSKDVTDDWRLEMLKIVTSQHFFRAMDARNILLQFSWEQERVAAGVTLFGRVVDPQNIDVMMMDYTAHETDLVLQSLGVFAVFTPSNPTGAYSLVLSRQLDFMLAQRLLELYITERNDGLCAEPFRCWRNATLNAQPILVTDPENWEIPLEGLLRLDYVSYRRWNLDDAQLEDEALYTLCHRLSKAGMGKRSANALSAGTLASELRQVQPALRPGTSRTSVFPGAEQAKKKAAKLKRALSGARMLRKSVQMDKLRKDLMIEAKKTPPKNAKLRAGALAVAGQVAIAREGRGEKITMMGASAEELLAQLVPGEGSVIHENAAKAMGLLRGVTEVCKLFMRASQLKTIMDLFPEALQKVEVLVMFFARVIDLKNFAGLVSLLPEKFQVICCNRLGYSNVFSLHRPELHYRLEMVKDDDREVAWRIAKLAIRNSDSTNLQNLRIDDQPITLAENNKLWICLCGHPPSGETPKTTLEFDFKISEKMRRRAAVNSIQNWWKKILTLKAFQEQLDLMDIPEEQKVTYRKSMARLSKGMM